MTDGHDRRPWLILSRREAEALYLPLITWENENTDLGRALRVIRAQLRFIRHRDDGSLKPDVKGALERERGGQSADLGRDLQQQR